MGPIGEASDKELVREFVAAAKEVGLSTNKAAKAVGVGQSMMSEWYRAAEGKMELRSMQPQTRARLKDAVRRIRAGESVDGMEPTAALLEGQAGANPYSSLASTDDLRTQLAHDLAAIRASGDPLTLQMLARDGLRALVAAAADLAAQFAREAAERAAEARAAAALRMEPKGHPRTPSKSPRVTRDGEVGERRESGLG